MHRHVHSLMSHTQCRWPDSHYTAPIPHVYRTPVSRSARNRNATWTPACARWIPTIQIRMTFLCTWVAAYHFLAPEQRYSIINSNRTFAIYAPPPRSSRLTGSGFLLHSVCLMSYVHAEWLSGDLGTGQVEASDPVHPRGSDFRQSLGRTGTGIHSCIPRRTIAWVCS